MSGMALAHGLRFLKSLLIARYYGTSGELDAYILSLAPFSLITGILIASLQSAIIPRYLELEKTFGQAKAFAVFRTFGICLLTGVAGLGMLIFVGSPLLSEILGSRFTDSQRMLTTGLLRLSIALLLLTICIESALCLFQSHRRFAMVSFSPLVNATLSIGYLLVFHEQGVTALLYGLIFGMAGQLGVVLWGGRQFIPPQYEPIVPNHPEVRRMFTAMVPLLLGASCGQVNLIIDQVMASRLPEGSLAALHYAAKLHQIFTQVFVVVVVQAVFPFLARQVADGEEKAIKKTFWMIAGRMLLVLVPISVGILFFGRPLVRLVFERGAFSAHSTATTTGAWVAYAVGLPIQAIRHLTVRLYNALQENHILLYVSAASIGVNILLNTLCMRIWGHIGIAVSTSGVYALSGAFLLYWLVRRRLWIRSE